MRAVRGEAVYVALPPFIGRREKLEKEKCIMR
ncbi:unnamed protein product, partial [marine sediment metagenome]